MHHTTRRVAVCRRLVALGIALVLLLALGDPAVAADVPPGAKEALAPVTRMISTLVAIAIGLGIAISGAVIVWGGIEKTTAGANAEAEHRAQRRIANGITGLVWMIVASVIVGTLTAIAVAYGLIDPPF
jgi:Type IV secretion system pilin